MFTLSAQIVLPLKCSALTSISPWPKDNQAFVMRMVVNTELCILTVLLSFFSRKNVRCFATRLEVKKEIAKFYSSDRLDIEMDFGR